MLRRPAALLSNFTNLLIVALAGWMIFNLVQSIQYIIADYSPLAIEDFWRVAQYWPFYKVGNFHYLWVQHNEHRIVFPELIYQLDMFLFKGHMFLPVVISGVACLTFWFALVWAAYSGNFIASPDRELALLLAGVIITWKGSSSLVAAPFQLQFTLVQAAVAIVLVSFVKLRETGGRRYLLVAVISAVIATYSSAHGILVWIILIAAALLTRLRAAYTSILIVSAVILGGGFFIGYRLPGSSPGQVLSHPGQALAFLCSYMSMPFGSFGWPTWATRVGAANLLLACGCAIVAYRRRILTSRPGMLACGFYAFALLSAVLTTMGRLDLGDTRFDQAKPWRYITLPVAMWAALAFLLVWLSGLAQSRQLTASITLIMVAFLAYGFGKSGVWVEWTRVNFADAQNVSTMLWNNVFDRSQVLTIFPSPEFVGGGLKILKADHKGIYSTQKHWLMPDELSRVHVGNLPIAGQVTQLYPVPGGLEVIGWAESNGLSEEHSVLFADAADKVVGFGRQPPAGVPVSESSLDAPRSMTFIGFISTAGFSEAKLHETYRVYIKTAHGRGVQPLNDTFQIPSFTAVDANSAATLLPGIEWSGKPVDVPNADPFSTRNHSTPVGPVFSSFTERTGAGEIRTSSFPNPPGHCLVLPVLHGLDTYGQSVQILEAGTGKSLIHLPLLMGRNVWRYWRIPLPPTASNILILATDQSAGRDQWIAVANPQTC